MFCPVIFLVLVVSESFLAFGHLARERELVVFLSLICCFCTVRVCVIFCLMLSVDYVL